MPQVIKKRKIVIASVLKPVDDARMFEKMGQALADTDKYEVHIIGFPSDKPRHYPNIDFHPSAQFPRLGLQRILEPFRILRKIRDINPDVLVITTHELLFVAVAFKVMTKTPVIYDIRENYFRNILFLPSFPLPVRPFLAIWVRMWEKLLSPFADRLIVSEKGYLKELPFTGDNTIVIENKVKPASIPPRAPAGARPGLRLLFSGTLAESTGVFTAIHVTNLLHEHDPTVHLTIIGYCAHADTMKRIRNAVDGHDHISLVGGEHLVPHDSIMEAVAQSDFGFVAYPPNPSTRNTIPTKLFEYLGAQLPILLINHPPWMEVCAPYPAALVFDPRHVKADTMLSRMRDTEFYVRTPGTEIFWESEGVRLVEVINKL